MQNKKHDSLMKMKISQLQYGTLIYKNKNI